MADVSENCFNCAVGNIFNITDVMGFSMIIYRCNHTNKEVVREKSVFFNWKKFFPLVSLLIICVSNYYAIERIREAIKHNISQIDLLFRSSDIILYTIASIAITQCTLQNERINYMFLFFDSILRDFTARTSWCLLSKDDVLYFRMRMYIILIMLSTGFSGAAVCLFCTGLDPVWSTIERVGLWLSIYSCFIMMSVALIFMKLVYRANSEYKHFLKIDLENIINDWSSSPYENENCSVVALPRKNILKLLKAYTDTFIEFNKMLAVFNKICDPMILISILFIMFFCVIFVFLVIVSIESQSSATIKFLSTELGMLIIITTTGYGVKRFAKMNTLNEGELSLLQKFPFSRFSSSENLQFHCFLYVVKRYQTKFVASEIITVDIPLFADILSTILTYVLVAVQFEFL